YIYLREVDGQRSFPIIIGFPEATEIQRVVTSTETERPMTHQLLHDTITQLGAHLASVDIVDVRQNTFYAQLVLENESGERVAVIDSRPSDSIALALRAKCPLRVSEVVLEMVRTDETGETEPGDSEPDSLPPG
ncbi:MAG: bifunctional DNase/RNase, partial [Candidatus Paceibacteria bacterium]